MPLGDGLPLVDGEIASEAVLTVCQDKKFVAPFCWLILHELLHPDPRLGLHHLLIDRQVLVGMIVCTAGVVDVIKDRTQTTKLVMTWLTTELVILSSAVGVIHVQVGD